MPVDNVARGMASKALATPGTGTLTSVGLAMPGIMTVSGSPITTSGTITVALATQTANLVWAGPASGAAAAPTFRALVAADIPAGGTGTVTSVGLALPASTFSVTGSPVTSSGTLTGSYASQSANRFLASPDGVAGIPTFRTILASDISAVAGTVTSVALSLPASVFTVTGSPVTTAGTLTGSLGNQPGNRVWASPLDGTTGPPTFRPLVAADNCYVPPGSGLKPSGGDDTAIVQAAINSNVQPVILFSGTFLITTELSVPSNVYVYGQGPSTIIDFKANGNAFHAAGKSNIILKDFNLVGHRVQFPATSNNGIYIDWVTTGGSNVILRNIDMKSFAGGGFFCLGNVTTPSNRLLIEGCRTDDMGGWAIISQDGISDVNIRNNYVGSCSQVVTDAPGLTASRNGKNIKVTGNTCISAGTPIGSSVHGISIDTSENVVCSDNVCVGWPGYGIECGFVTNCLMTNNTVRGGTYGIACSGNQAIAGAKEINITVSGNTVMDQTSVGIYMFISNNDGTVFHKNVAIASNTVLNSGGIGIETDLVDGLALTGNVIQNCVLSGFYTIDIKGWRLTGNVIRSNNTSANAAYAGVSLRNVKLTPAGVVPAPAFVNAENLIELNGFTQIN